MPDKRKQRILTKLAEAAGWGEARSRQGKVVTMKQRPGRRGYGEFVRSETTPQHTIRTTPKPALSLRRWGRVVKPIVKPIVKPVVKPVVKRESSLSELYERSNRLRKEHIKWLRGN